MRYAIFFIAIAMAAISSGGCNALYGYGEDDTLAGTADVFLDSGKEDNPYLYDIILPDTNGETATADSSIDDTVVECVHTFPDGTLAECSGSICTLEWLENCRVQCNSPHGSPWGPTGTSEYVVKNTCKPL